MEGNFKLRCILVGHEKDVRAVSVAGFPAGSFISGSRDITARIWIPNEFNAGFTEGHVMSGHTRFVSSVCYMPPSDKYVHGVIVTGSSDSNILGFTLESPLPVFKLEGHSDNVCALACGKFGTLLSGSWDTTAKVWVGGKEVMSLNGHSLAVWAVAMMPEGGRMLTASADKSVKMWKAGKLEKTFTGHADCVRGLAVLNATDFLSCSNDATIRRWTIITGQCVQTFHGHTNFVYSISVMPDGSFVTSGEDRTVRVWQDGQCSQTISHPTQSIWSVCCMDNGDIVTGASDAVIRVFTRDPSRMASEDEQAQYNEQVAASEIPQQVGDIKIQDLPGPEALLRPGKTDGQVLTIRNLSKVEAHQWSGAEKKWVKMGDVVGSSGGSQATSGKMLYEGKEYDYVFDIDVEDGKPPLKLPYNLTEDPWFTAQTFIHKNNLSQLFLDQIANFITENTKSATLNQVPASGAADPFTGGNRYQPGAGVPFPTNASADASDPFTGAGRYVPGAGSSFPTNTAGGSDPLTGSGRYVPSSAAEVPKTNSFYPKTTVLTFDSCNSAALLGKVSEFNGCISPHLQLNDGGLIQLKTMLESSQHTEEQLILLDTLLQWPIDKVFPALDILRMVVRKGPSCDRFCLKNGKSFLEYLLHFLKTGSPVACQMLALRTLCNLFGQQSGLQLILENRDDVFTTALLCKGTNNKNIQIALTTVLLNYAVVSVGSSSENAPKSPCLSALSVLAQHEMDAEAMFRALVCLGTLVHNDEIATALANSLCLDAFISTAKTVSTPPKVSECARHVASELGC